VQYLTQTYGPQLDPNSPTGLVVLGLIILAFTMLAALAASNSEQVTRLRAAQKADIDRRINALAQVPGANLTFIRDIYRIDHDSGHDYGYTRQLLNEAEQYAAKRRAAEQH